MILWDIASGERLRTFEGHDRGLACIEFKVMFLFFFAPFKKKELTKFSFFILFLCFIE